MRKRTLIVLIVCGVFALVLAVPVLICVIDCFAPTAQVALFTLDLSCDSTQTEIERAYRRKAKQHHPDKSGSTEPVPAEFKALEDATTTMKKFRCFPRNVNVAIVLGIMFCASVAVTVLVSDKTPEESSEKMPVLSAVADEPALPNVIHLPALVDNHPEVENEEQMMEHQADAPLPIEPNGDAEVEAVVPVGQPPEVSATVNRLFSDENPSATTTSSANPAVRTACSVADAAANDNSNSVGPGALDNLSNRLFTAAAHRNEMGIPAGGSRSVAVVPPTGMKNALSSRSARKKATFKDRVSLIDEVDKENEDGSPEIRRPEFQQKKAKRQKTVGQSPVATPRRKQPMRAAKTAALAQNGRRGN